MEVTSLSRAKILKISLIAAVAVFIFALCYALLSGQTFYADLVAEKVRDAIEKSGQLKISWGKIKGNPLTGVYLSDARILSGDMELARIDEMGMNVALLSAASPNARLSKLSLNGLVSDYDNFEGFSFGRAEGETASPIDAVTVMNSNIKTPRGMLTIKDGAFVLRGQGYKADVEGIFSEIPFEMNGKADISGSSAILSNFLIGFGDMTVKLSGHLTPSLSLDGEVKNLDAKKMAELFSPLKEYGLSGIYSASFLATNSTPENLESLEISGSLASPSGGVMGIPYREFSTRFYSSGGYFQFRSAAVNMLNGKMSGDLDVNIASGGTPSVAARFNASSIDTSVMKGALPWMENFIGIIDAASCDVAGPINALSAKARLASSEFKAASFSCTGVRANVVLDGGKKLNANFLGNVQGAPAKGSANIFIGDAVNVSADIFIPKVSAASLRSNFNQLRDFKIAGDASIGVGIKGSADNLLFTVSLASSGLDLMDGYHISDAAAELSYAKNTLGIKSARAKWQDASFSAEGSVVLPQNGASPKLALSGKFSNLNIAKLGGAVAAVKNFKLGGVASGAWVLSGDAIKPVARVEASAPKFFIYGKYMLADARAAAEYSNASVNLSSAFFKLGKGEVTAAGTVTVPAENRPLEYNMKGSFKNLDPAVFVSMGLVSQDISGELAGDARIWKAAHELEPSVRLFFKNSEFNYANMANLTGLNGTITYSGGGLSFERLRTNLNNGSISIDGSAGNIMEFEKPSAVPLNLKVAATSADIDRIARIFAPESKGFQGLANANAVIKGSLGSPSFTADGTLRAVRAFGLFLPVINFSGVNGDKNRVEIPKIRAAVGRGSIDASGSIDIANGFEARVRASGTSVDIRSLTVQLENETRREITGALDFTFEGSGPPENFKGKGHGRIPNLSLFGVKLSDVDADVSIADGFVIVEDSSARAYGGGVKVQAVKDLSRTSWGGRVVVTSADMAPAFKDLAPDSEGSISGVTNFSMQFSGDSRRTSMRDGNGKLEILDGEISGFEGAEAVSKLVGGKPLRFHSALFTFTLDGHTVYIIPGSRISAPKEDPVYKYVTLDGSVTMEQEVDLSCMGNVNIRALNALAAGLQGVLAATVESGGIADSGELLKNFLGNTITGFSRNEFRDVSLKVSGKPGDIKFSKVSIAAPIKMDPMPSALKNPDGYKEERGVKLKVEIPVGPGGDGHPKEGVGGQISGQILDQLIKGLIFDEE
jgi:uncharacterized protein involved in outer membrane biogenesis